MQPFRRAATLELSECLAHFPAVVLTGPRQCGKTTLAQEIARSLDRPTLDLILEKGSRRLAFEFKASSAPDVTRGFHQAIADLQPEHAYIVAPVEQPYPIGKNLTIRPPWPIPPMPPDLCLS